MSTKITYSKLYASLFFVIVSVYMDSGSKFHVEMNKLDNLIQQNNT